MDLNRLFLDHFAKPVGVIKGAMLYKIDIDPQDANGQDHIFAQITIRSKCIDIWIKQLIEEPGTSPVFLRRNHVQISHDQNIGEAIQSAVNDSFNYD